MKYNGLIYAKIIGKYTTRKQHSDYVDKLERDFLSQQLLAGELIAAIKANFKAGTFSTSTPELFDEWLQPFIARLVPHEAPPGREEQLHSQTTNHNQ